VSWLGVLVNGASNFDAVNMTHVLRATDLDPDNAGLFGTRTLR
jgi:hypothetical protein